MRGGMKRLGGASLAVLACGAGLAATPPQQSPDELLRRAAARVLDARTAGPVTLTYSLRFADGTTGTYSWSQRDRDNNREEIRISDRSSSRGALAGCGWQTPGHDAATAWWLVEKALALGAQLAPDEIHPMAAQAREIDGEAFAEVWAERPPELGRRVVFLTEPDLDLGLSEIGELRRSYADWKQLRGVGAVPGVARVYVAGALALEMRLERGTNRPVAKAELAPPPGSVERAHCSDEVAPPKLVRRTPPAYPEEARRARVQGVFVVAATIGADGAVTDAHLIYPVAARSDSRALMGDAAVAAVKTWRYEPARCQGAPIATDLNVTVTFTLK